MFCEQYDMVQIDSDKKIITAITKVDDIYKINIQEGYNYLGDVMVTVNGQGILSIHAKKRLAFNYYGCWRSDNMSPTTKKAILYVPYCESIRVECAELDVCNVICQGGNFWWWFFGYGLKRRTKDGYVSVYRGLQAKYVDMPINIKYHGWELRYE